MGLLKYILLLPAVAWLPFNICSQTSEADPAIQVFAFPEGVSADDYLVNTIIFKVKPQYRSLCAEASIDQRELNEIFKELKAYQIEKKFSGKEMPEKKANDQGLPIADLSLIYEMTYSAPLPLDKAINMMLFTGILEYAVPHYLPKLLYTPNDPSHLLQYYLSNINAYGAWDISKGDTNIVIGIVDTGTDLLHPDLKNKIKYNYADPIDNIDNDNDGFKDNFHGWDLGENDSYPQVSAIYHGVHVSGIAAADVDNNFGMAGTGFNCKFLPVKADNAEGVMTMSYEGIVYAADHGCDIINCSWGDDYNHGPFGQDVINYATINRNSLVIAACGNSYSERLFYPASYKYVLSVAATDNNDVKWVNSSYGPEVDICAPGHGIYSTWVNNGFVTSSGTSMAAPVVAGCAAILKSNFPNLSAIQLAERLKVTADIIDTLPANQQWKDMLGSGRVNLYRALTDVDKPSVTLDNVVIHDNNDNDFTLGDTLNIIGEFKNWLAPAANLSIKLECLSPFVQLLDTLFNVGPVPAMGVVVNTNMPFRAVLHPGTPASYKVLFRFTFKDTLYQGFDYFTLDVNTDYLIIDTNQVMITVTGKGRIGYNDDWKTQGDGFRYKDPESLLSCGGFMVANSSAQVSDNIYALQGYCDDDFLSVSRIRKVVPSADADYEAIAVFNDDGAGVNKMDIEVNQRALAWVDSANAKYVVLEYLVKNKGFVVLDSLYMGIFADWDIRISNRNRIEFDTSAKMGYCYSLTGGPYAGVQLLEGKQAVHYAIDNGGQDGSINVYDGFSGYEKYQAMTTNRLHAGTSLTTGNDVSHILSTGPYHLRPGDSVKAVFAILAGDHYADIKDMAAAAQKKYDKPSSTREIDYLDFECMPVYPNPASGKAILPVFSDKPVDITITIHDIFGKKMKDVLKANNIKGSQQITLDFDDFEPGIYFLKIHSEDGISIQKVIVVK